MDERMKRKDDPHVDEVIDHVRLFIAQQRGCDLQRTDAPDHHVRNVRACDALLEGGGIHFAVARGTPVTSFDLQVDVPAREKVCVIRVVGWVGRPVRVTPPPGA